MLSSWQHCSCQLSGAVHASLAELQAASCTGVPALHSVSSKQAAAGAAGDTLAPRLMVWCHDLKGLAGASGHVC